MNQIKKWLHSRSESIQKSRHTEKVTVSDFIAICEQDLGLEKTNVLKDLIKSEASFLIHEARKSLEPLEFIEKYNNDTIYRKSLLDSQPSEFHKQLLKQAVTELSRKSSFILQNLTLHDLEKAVKPKDWNRITKKSNPEAELTVDSKPHMTQFPVHSDYAKILNDPKEHTPHKLDENGISAKMVHAPGDSTFMAKPYHKNIESATKSWVKHPILGWATMATKALFNAGNIGHLAEDVSAHEHEGVPLTVHKIAKDHYSQSQLRGGNAMNGFDFHPNDIHQIGVMDYLTNNLDRHAGNLMIGDYKDERGYNPLLAIDHERNFQYARHLDHKYAYRARDNDIYESPLSYIQRSALSFPNKHASKRWQSHHETVDWWKQHGQKIKDEMENQVSSITDKDIREHVRNNFNQRWHKMNDWTNNLAKDPDQDAMYQPETLGHGFDVRNQQIEKPKITANQLKSLPKNKKDALLALGDIINKKGKVTPKQRSILSSAMQNIISTMSPQEAAESFTSIVHNPYMNTKAIKNDPELDLKQQMLNHFSSDHGWENNAPKFKYDHMSAMADAIDALPENKKETLKGWSNHYRDKLNERQRQVA